MADVEQISAMAMEKREKKERKRVRFSGDHESDDDEAPEPRQALFPKAKKAKESVDEEEDGGPILAADPRVAAKERATRRKDQIIANDDTGMLDDVADAEEEYQGKDADEVNEIEPFNLKKEREEGYFDADGNYVEYRLEKDIQDAWLDSTTVDERFAAKAAAQAAAADEPPPELSAAEMAAIKRRIADALEPNETVLQGLRRLGGTGRKAGKKKGIPLGRDERMPEGTKERFDRLTEDAMKLMDAGEYGVYSEAKETFEREAAGYEALARARSGPSTGGSDMFGDSDDEEAKAQPLRPASSSEPMPESTEGRDVAIQQGGSTSSGPLTDGPSNQGATLSSDSGYVLDPSTGYYYNSNIGYYYDANSGLFCSASSGLWYRYIESTSTYEEITGG